MKIKIISIFTLFFVISVSCQSSKHVQKVEVSNNSQSSSFIVDSLGLTEGIGDFSFDYFKVLSQLDGNKNLCFSPVSLQLAFAMVYSGAMGDTYKEISKVLKFPYNPELFYQEFDLYYKFFGEMAQDKELDFNLANRVFVEKTYKILDSYRETVNKHYDGSFEDVDFRGSALKVTEHINNWVELMTKNRIKDLIPLGILDASTKMVLVNAIYIKSKWKYAFDESYTRKKDFFINNSQKKSTDFMCRTQNGIKYYSDNKICAIELPYTSNKLSLIIIKPHESNIETIDTYIPDYKTFLNILKEMRFNEVAMEIPKFKIESSFSLKESLQKKGLRSIFSGSANLSAMSLTNDIYVDQVLQKVFFEIDEKGSEAAAATAITVRATSSMNYQGNSIVYFIANKPFIFILKENNTNTPLFIGKYVIPQ